MDDIWSMLGSIATQSGADNASSGGIRSMIDIANKHQLRSVGDYMKDLMTNAPPGVTQLTKGPWNFNG